VHPGCYAITAVEPLASLAGAAAFLLAVPQSPRWSTLQSGVLVKEPIENQANRHFQT